MRRLRCHYPQRKCKENKNPYNHLSFIRCTRELLLKFSISAGYRPAEGGRSPPFHGKNERLFRARDLVKPARETAEFVDPPHHPRKAWT